MVIRGWRFVNVGSCGACTHDGIGACAGTATKNAVRRTIAKYLYRLVFTAEYICVVGFTKSFRLLPRESSLSWSAKRMTFTLTLIGFFCLLLAFGVWLAVVAPVNSDVADALRSAPESVPMLWLRLRNRWEYGRAAGFVLQLVGFCAFVLSVLMETPKVWEGEKNPGRVSERTRERVMATHAR